MNIYPESCVVPIRVVCITLKLYSVTRPYKFSLPERLNCCIFATFIHNEKWIEPKSISSEF